ncbi:MAG: hypothetical protein H3C43_06845 [Leptonema sp. (in: Bacteria)]|nr:hypothetical protein [Leptonema sp. (in: bacteria)]
MANLDSYNKLKRINGIRNRFWARSPEQLAPLLQLAHQRALLRNHRSLLVAMRAVERKLRKSESVEHSILQQTFYDALVRSMNYLRRVGPFSLKAGQKAALVSKGFHVSLSIRNSDGSLDAALRRRMLLPIERIANWLPKSLTEEERHTSPGEVAANWLLSQLPIELELTDQPSSELFDELIESPTGQLLDNMIPGFSILFKLYKERQRLKDGEWISVVGELIGDGARSSTQAIIKVILSQLKSGAKLAGPLSFLFGVSFDRASLLNKQSNLVDFHRKRIEELQPLYKNYR